MLDYGSRHTTPVTLGTAIGMTWAAAFEKDGSVLKRAWVIGPVFYQDVSLRGIEQGLQYYNRLETSVAWTMQLYEVLKTVPVLQCTVLHRYALMMHYCLTGNHLAISDINSEFWRRCAIQCSSPLTIATRSGWQSRDFCRWCAPVT